MKADDKERLWSRNDMAWILGITVRQLDNLVSQRIITPKLVRVDGRKVRRYDPVETNAAYRDYVVKTATDRQAKSFSAASAGLSDDIDVRLKELTAAYKEEQIVTQKYKNEINSGKLVYTDEVAEELRVFFGTFKKFALSIPSRVTGMIAGLLEPLEVRRISQELQREMSAQLAGFVDSVEEKTEDDG